MLLSKPSTQGGPVFSFGVIAGGKLDRLGPATDGARLREATLMAGDQTQADNDGIRPHQRA
jgi:hypothetical protein